MTALDSAGRETRERDRPHGFVHVVCAVGAGLLGAAIVSLVRTPPHPFWIVLAVLSVGAGILPLRLPRGAATFSIGEAFSLTSLFLYGTPAGVVTAALDSLGILLRVRTTPTRATFNAAAPAVAMAVAGGLAFDGWAIPLPGRHGADWTSWLAACAAAAVYFLTETVLVGAAVALTGRRTLRSVWREHFAPLWSGPAAGAYFAGLAALGVSVFGPLAVVALLPVPAFFYMTVRATVERSSIQMRHIEATARMYEATIEAFAAAVDARDDVTHEHVARVKTRSVALLRALGVDDQPSIQALEAGALLHDVGKIGIPDVVLNKPGRLTPEEYGVMKRHVEIGVRILRAVEFPFPVMPIVRHHHENWDGTGYPDGLAGNAIPLAARVLSVVDCFDALTSDRPYRPALAREAAFAILQERRGTMYDPAVVDAFFALEGWQPPRVASGTSATS